MFAVAGPNDPLENAEYKFRRCRAAPPIPASAQWVRGGPDFGLRQGRYWAGLNRITPAQKPHKISLLAHRGMTREALGRRTIMARC